jgi:hypothetical protein
MHSARRAVTAASLWRTRRALRRECLVFPAASGVGPVVALVSVDEDAMRARPQHRCKATEAEAVRRQWLLARAGLPLLAAALSFLTGCLPTVEEQALAEETTESNDVAAADPMMEALRNGAYATPEEVGGFCVEGVGVFLSAVGGTAELTLYVVAPAERMTFDRPALYLTTRDGDHENTEVAEFDAVTLQAGESRVFRRAATDGTLVGVFADFAD